MKLLLVEKLFVKGDKTSFTSIKDYNSGTINFRDRSLAHVKCKGSIVIPSCPKLDGILYVEGLKANLLSISQMCDKDHRVNICQDLCEVIDKEGNVYSSQDIGQ
ncbi:hypothetical protein CK203_101679 [Vitis vinifera]|uniref:Retrovirus-related Pol polyprotein from transposon TNT 1-94-like beta-barrel domain-containing protein n=1 Tax=Vitis vinifera TaxID=29760 RepID=A0A438FHS8_VITVI|nr:hypothetical protein CK203_101679 [Vitis vinifera]